MDVPKSLWRDRLMQGLTALLWITAVAAAASLAVEYGFEPERVPLPGWLLIATQVLAVSLFVARCAWGLVVAADRVTYLKSRWLEIGVIALGLVALLIESEWGDRPRALYVITIQVVLVAELLYHLSLANVLLARRHHPTRLMIASFLLVILIGTALLALPRATRPQRIGPTTSLPRHVLNCAFTAVSATCVTGLIVYDTETELTLFGKAVVLVLMQLGGLGIMVFGTFFGLLLGRRISLHESLMMKDVIAPEAVGHVGRMLRFIVIATFTFEAAGAVLLYGMWAEVEPWHLRAFTSVFHAVSGFCNAGFSLQSDSLVAYRGCWQVYGVMMPLIVLGGLGFPVLHDIYEWIAVRLSRKGRGRDLGLVAGRPGRLTVHSKITLLATGVLIIFGAVLLMIFETPGRHNARYPADLRASLRPRPPIMAGETSPQRGLHAVFQSVTARTAGFNTTPTTISALSPASHMSLMLLMFIGGSPASTAGGVKTVTFALVLLGAVATIRRREEVEFAGRTIPAELVRRAGALMLLMFALIAVTALLLTFSDGENARFLELMFESVSACGTVGLSCGVAPELTAFGKGVIMLAMFAGRLGPLTILIALAGRPASRRVHYPEEGVVIG